MHTRSKVKEETKRAAKKVIEKAEEAGSRALQAIGETPELIHLQRTERALKSEQEDHWKAIGKRAYVLHKQARGDSPFSGFRSILKELEALAQVEEEYRANRIQLNQLRERLRGKGVKR